MDSIVSIEYAFINTELSEMRSGLESHKLFAQILSVFRTAAYRMLPLSDTLDSLTSFTVPTGGQRRACSGSFTISVPRVPRSACSASVCIAAGENSKLNIYTLTGRQTRGSGAGASLAHQPSANTPSMCRPNGGVVSVLVTWVRRWNGILFKRVYFNEIARRYPIYTGSVVEMCYIFDRIWSRKYLL